MVQITNLLLLQLILLLRTVKCDLLFKQDTNYRNTFCRDKYLDKNKKASKTMCAAECRMEPECVAFFYDVRSNCYVTTQTLIDAVGCVYLEGTFYRSETGSVTTTVATSSTTTESCTYTRMDGTRSRGRDIHTVESTSSSDPCINLCTSDPLCAGVNFNPGRQRCKTRTEAALTSHNGLIWYEKIC
ncbi:hypothetical protein MAR_006010 [Mya arenaria]|uniref:Apple domain-containing protein n=1 Tax=Mya arenaria TaxID=6604 RepID=A0ABY7D788_MYAAR|nr:hypothetical protein MAR_006010 [Mya arenaria]